MKSDNKSSAQIAQDSVNKLKNYIKNIDPLDIPTNQFGVASRRPICKELGITYSTIGSNDKLALEFEKLDKLVNASARKPNSKSSDTKHLEMRITSLENRIASLKADNEELRTKLKRYEHFELTGRMPR